MAGPGRPPSRRERGGRRQQGQADGQQERFPPGLRHLMTGDATVTLGKRADSLLVYRPES